MQPEYSSTEINDEQWKELDFLLERVESGVCPEAELHKNQAFVMLLKEVDKDINYFKRVPHFIRKSPVIEEHCVKQITAHLGI